ncbi:hypothetical protein PQX77_000045 [Marasmius sp. AFHP31]|nr:hypothetical protein PQX77_000045 [Marasmius sp. AFHP31]
MIGSPLRRCIATGQYLPSDFLIRLGIMRLPSTRPLRFVRHGLHVPAVLVPDGLQHSKFTTRRAGTAVYVLCRKEAIEHMNEKGAQKRFSADLHDLLGQQIQHLLRLRVLQELQLLLEQVGFRRKGLAHQTLIRRLTRREWEHFRSTGIVQIDNAVAVLVVPPAGRDPVTKERPTPSMSSSPPSHEPQKRENPNDATTRPLSELLPVSPQPLSLNSGPPEDLATHQVPIYHGVPMFPDRTQRAVLHKLLLQILNVERRARFGRTKHSDSEEKPSHAFVLLADKNTIQHGDVAALAIALWRIRMFEGSGWDVQSGWLQRSKYRSVLKFE